ncbi:MAG: restriction endonuclease subunit S [Patescibacteria group bacterium]|nr:restriction endonuclease subunit S [Patescibacteria group bacterium]
MAQCTRCLKTFRNAAELGRHAEKKYPCTPAADAVRAAEVKVLREVKTPTATLLREIHQARDILRTVGIQGLEALGCITCVLILRELDVLYGDELAKTKNYPKSVLGRFIREKILANEWTRFSKIVESPFSRDDGTNFADVIRDAITVLGTCEGVGKYLGQPENITRIYQLADNKAAYELIQYCKNHIRFDGHDAIGGGYGAIVKDSLEGKELGQFFTPTPIVQYAIGAVAKGRALGDVLDPTCGSGGFIAAMADADSVTGYEIDPRVAVLAFAHCLVARRQPNTDNIVNCDFLRMGEVTQFDTVVANPPFGVKLKYDELMKEFIGNEEGAASFPLKTSSTGLFLQRIVRVLKVDGRAAVVLPLGKELAGAGTELKLRRLLLKSCNISEIVSIPSGVFENTGIRTVLIVFEKVREMSECLVSKGKKRITIDIDPEVEDATSEIKFFEMQKDGTIVEPVDGKTLVSFDELKERGFSLSPDDYKNHQMETFEVADGIEMVRLGDIGELKAGKNITKSELKEGDFPVVGGGQSPLGYHSTANTDADAIIISKIGAYAGHVAQYPTAVFLTGNGCEFRIKNPEAHHPRFIKHMLSICCQADLYKMQKGSNQPEFHRAVFYEYKIPVPSIELQTEISRRLDNLISGIDAAKRSIEHYDQLMETLIKWGLGRVKVVKLGDICSLKSGKNINKASLIPGEYPVIGGGMSPMGFHNAFNTDRHAIIISATGASCGFVNRYETKTFRSADAIEVVNNTETIDSNYLFYVLKSIQGDIQKLRNGMAQPHLDKQKMLSVGVPLPSLKVQKRIVAQLDEWASTRDGLRKCEEDTRGLMKQLLQAALAQGELVETNEEPKNEPASDPEKEPAADDSDGSSESADASDRTFEFSVDDVYVDEFTTQQIYD